MLLELRNLQSYEAMIILFQLPRNSFHSRQGLNSSFSTQTLLKFLSSPISRIDFSDDGKHFIDSEIFLVNQEKRC